MRIFRGSPVGGLCRTSSDDSDLEKKMCFNLVLFPNECPGLGPKYS